MSIVDGRPEFLGWDGPLIQRAAEHLVAGLAAPTDLGDTLIAVPGARSGRLLLAHLARAISARGWTGFFPPRVLTPGRLVDELVDVGGTVADRTTRTLAWERALVSMDAGTRSTLLARVPDRDARAAWWRVAEDIRSLHAELAVEGLDFEDVGERLEQDGSVPPSEVRRWEALYRVQEAWRAELTKASRVDPHEGRHWAIESGRARRDASVILVGVLEVNGLLRKALSALDTAPRALVFAPEERRSAFGAFGEILPERWAKERIDIPFERWHVVENPDDQARMAIAAAAAAGGPERAVDLAIGVPDEEVVPYLTRRLSAAGVRARDAAGIPLEQTPPLRLLSALQSFLETGSAADWVALVRHPDLERQLDADIAGPDGSELAEPGAVLRVDGYLPEHLPRRLDLVEPDVPKGVWSQRDIGPMLRRVRDLAGPLASGLPRPLGAAAGDLRAFLLSIYGNHPGTEWRDGETPDEREARRILMGALEALGEALTSLENVPPEVAGTALPAAAIGLALRTARSAAALPPAPSLEDEPSVELLGWLEILLDEAPHLVVTGFTEGHVPESPGGDTFLPDRVRGLFGLEDEQHRLGRDVYLTAALMASRDRVDFVSGRRTRDGDPLFPSRLAFLGPREGIPERLDHALEPRAFEPVERGDASAEVQLPPVVLERPAPEEFTVTSFRTFLESPKLFHVRRQLRLETVDDRVGEMDAARFGSLAHDVLEDFGNADARIRDSDDPDVIFAFLQKRLNGRRSQGFPDSVLPAVPLQIQQLQLRLRNFAEWQAKEAAAGWRIRHVEWSPSDSEEHPKCARLEMGAGESDAWIKGKIDRIDQHAGTGAWRVLDYKTSHKANDPETVHRKVKKGEAGPEVTWKDLQLPLYAHMTQALVGKGQVPLLGYLALPGDGGTELKIVGKGKGWDRASVDDALNVARGVIRSIRAGDFGGEDTLRYLSSIEEELFGVGLVLPPDSSTDDEDAALAGSGA